MTPVNALIMTPVNASMMLRGVVHVDMGDFLRSQLQRALRDDTACTRTSGTFAICHDNDYSLLLINLVIIVLEYASHD